MAKFSEMVSQINEETDEGESMDSLLKQANEMKIITDRVGREILVFLSDYRKYFGKVFIYAGNVRFTLYNLIEGLS